LIVAYEADMVASKIKKKKKASKKSEATQVEA
jgi:hypothetical protein